ncbi:MAG: class I SAM-dependent methyltransferase [Lewinellaceae bacterium]|nr:class I SAM-dependent methyltransferase [Lewinellaceae bacterium]
MADQFEKSYSLHEQHFYKYSKGGDREQIARNWFQEGTIGYEQAMQRNAVSDPLLLAYPGASWLTVGDGRYGSDAHYLASKGADATASDIADALLREGAEAGFISKYSKENAEALSFADNSFDFVLCKESYHHFPRPMKALYEMLRVGRRGTVLYEPVDPYVYTHFLQALFRGILQIINALGVFKLLLGKEMRRHTYEDVGNYVYKISEREIEKVALGLNYPCVAFKGLNIHYCEGVDGLPVNRFSFAKLQVRLVSFLLNLLSFLKIIAPQSMAAIIFKEMPSEDCLRGLKDAGYRVVKLPRNPYW